MVVWKLYRVGVWNLDRVSFVAPVLGMLFLDPKPFCVVFSPTWPRKHFWKNFWISGSNFSFWKTISPSGGHVALLRAVFTFLCCHEL